MTTPCELRSNPPGGSAEAERARRDVYAEATEPGEPPIEIRALARSAQQFAQSDPEKAFELLRAAKEMAQVDPDAFANRQGAHIARLLAESATALAINGKPALDDALGWLCLAIDNSGRCDARQELAQALYQLGNLFEHYHLVGRDAPLVAAWACYALARTYAKKRAGGSPLNAQVRIDERIVPRIEEAQRSAAAAAVIADPWRLIDAALSPRTLGWHPVPGIAETDSADEEPLGED